MDHLDYLPPYSEIFDTYLLTNKPFILSSIATEDWPSRKDWVTQEGKPNLSLLKQDFGEAIVPVADCNQCTYAAQPKSDWKLRDYMDYMNKHRGCSSTGSPLLYLKDWHFQREHENYIAYTTPEYFTSDWLNEFMDCGCNSDDYRFVYIGVEGSWTPFHADVFHSFSWSANVCGKKKWIIYPKGEEESVRDKLGKLAYDVTASVDGSERVLVVTQGPGEVIFIPSGWYHQVLNLEDTISINHNWINGCNVATSWEFIKKSMRDVEREIDDCRGMDGWQHQCQMILKADSGIDYQQFYTFLHTIAMARIQSLGNRGQQSLDVKLTDATVETGCVRKCCLLNTGVCGGGTSRGSGETKQRFTNHDKSISSTRDMASDTRDMASDTRDMASDTRDMASDTRDMASDTRDMASDCPVTNEHSCDICTPNDVTGYCQQFDPSHPCHIKFDLSRILFVLEDMVIQEQFTFLEFSDWEVKPIELIKQIQAVLTKHSL